MGPCGFSTQLFVFTNRRRTQCRILYWERCGFVLWEKRLERARFVERPYLLMDETTVQVLKEPGKAPESKSQLWVQMSAGPEPPIVLFEYAPTRAGDVPKRLLAGFTGALTLLPAPPVSI